MRIAASVKSAHWLIPPAFWGAEPLSALARQKVAYGVKSDPTETASDARFRGNQALNFDH
jgi:hypothetical protein